MGRPTVQDAIDQIKKSGGFVSTAAAKLGTSRNTLHQMINKHPKLKEAVDDARALKKDHAEGKLLQAIDEGNITAIIFYLKTQGKDRGYVERVEQDLNMSGTLDLSKRLLDQANKIWGDD